MTAACIAATRLRNNLRPKSPTRADLWRRKQERERKTLVSALNAYAKQNNMKVNTNYILSVATQINNLPRLNLFGSYICNLEFTIYSWIYYY